MTDPAKTITTYWHPSSGELCPAHDVGTDDEGRRLYQLGDGFVPVTAYWLNDDGLAVPETSYSKARRTIRAACLDEVNLTTEEQAHLPIEELLDAAMAEAENAGIVVDRDDLRIVAFTL